jgi:hypothetical protein
MGSSRYRSESSTTKESRYGVEDVDAYLGWESLWRGGRDFSKS